MLTLTSQQVSALNQLNFKNFLLRMQLSLTKNMHLQEPVPLEELRPVVEKVLKEYRIKDESLIEKFLILYYHYPEMRQPQLPAPVAEILNDTYRTEHMKLDELTTYLFFQLK